ncbi:MerR family transcriptional regulator [Zooshikella ganghwensis]|uniref:MerR family transcriptional regulator n=1 Tax=Zooshikella ganghwensis TaxID=202772 RepID=UPI00040FD73A|nr:MerR family transcriptional regulator [Zooshikella ganghwensis]
MTELVVNENTEGLIPIREVSRLTGVNAVTLRAWERRYGLITPYRTAKGHRLYDQEHVTQIKSILEWINRGVAVSKVKALLANVNNTKSQTAPGSNVDNWQIAQTQFINAVKTFNDDKLDDIYNQALAIYPIDIVSENLIKPVIIQLKKNWQGQFGQIAEQCFLLTQLRAKLTTRLYHNNKSTTGPKVLLTQLATTIHTEFEIIDLLLTALALSAHNYHVQLLAGKLPYDEVSLAVEKLQSQAVIIFSQSAFERHVLQKELQHLQQLLTVPLILTGQCTMIHEQQLHTTSTITATDNTDLIKQINTHLK